MRQQLPKDLQKYFKDETAFSEITLAAVALSYAREHVDPAERPLVLAAIFDLVVASKFYRAVKPENWIWCEHGGRAEVKAAPLFTPPLAVKHSNSFSTVRTLPFKHAIGTLRGMEQQEVCLFLPMAGGQHFSWSISKKGLGDPSWPESALIEAIQSKPLSFQKYLESWRLLWETYKSRDTTNPAFWFTGACGLPRDPGEGWPKTGDGKPKGSVSDGKTSVGMDRTDDIKKSTFQVLKLGVEARQIDLQDWSLKIGLASNLHAVRHYDDYLLPYADIVWGWSEASTSPNKWFNLYDGIVAFSKSHTRDQWLTDTTDWSR